MKLLNKKTGEIREIKEILIDGMFNVSSLAELNENWEEYEEPKKFWYMTAWGDVKEYSQDQFAIKQKQEIGNYFETEEEAKKAVEKLKAWKRLKDKGFRFKNYMRNQTGTYDCFAIWEDNIPPSSSDIAKDLDLLFGDDDE